MTRKRFGLSAKVVVRDGEGRVLLLRRSMNSKNNPGRWDLPGGKVDAGETFDVALLREIEEETALHVSLTRVAGAAESQVAAVTVAYLIMEGALESGDVRLSDEHDRFAWVEPAELPTIDVCEQFRPLLETYSDQAS